MKPGSKPTSGTPLGANKYPGRNQVNGTTGTAKKAIGGVAGGATKTLGGATGGATKALGGVTSGAAKSVTSLSGSGASSFKGPSYTPSPNKTLPKPYPKANNLPKPYTSNAFPSSGPKTAVKPGQPKPFVPPVEQKKKKTDEKKPYPGTNTLPGTGSRTPVQQQKYKPLPRLGPQVGQGQKMQHLAI